MYRERGHCTSSLKPPLVQVEWYYRPRGKHAVGQVFNSTVSLQAAKYNTYYVVHKTSSYHKHAEYNMNKGTN